MAPESDRLDLPTEIKTVVLPNHQFPQFPQLPSYEMPAFDIMKENFHETDSDWLHYESSGARHSYPSPGSLGVPMVRDPHVPIRNLSSRRPSYTNIQDEVECSFKQRVSLDSDFDESRPKFAITTLPTPQSASALVDFPETPTKPKAKTSRNSELTPKQFSRSSTWLPGSLELDRRLQDLRVQQSKREVPSQRNPRPHAPTSAKVSSSRGSSLLTGPNKSTNSPISTSPAPITDTSSDFSDLATEAISRELRSISATRMTIVPADDNGDQELEITISNKMRPVSSHDGVTKFCIFEGTSSVTTRSLDPQLILGFEAQIGDIYTHAFTNCDTINIQVWMLDAAGMWTDVTQALNAHDHIHHPKTDKLALWMKLPGGPPNYVQPDTYRRYLRDLRDHE